MTDQPRILLPATKHYLYDQLNEAEQTHPHRCLDKRFSAVCRIRFMTPRTLMLSLSLLLPLAAAAQLPRNEVSILAGWTEFADRGGARAIGASFGHYWTPVLSTEVGGFAARGRVSLTDIHATTSFHPLRDHRLSPWLAIGLASVTFEAEKSTTTITTIGGVGLDWNLTPRLAIGGQFEYSTFVINPRDRFPTRVNPATLTLATRWRF